MLLIQNAHPSRQSLRYDFHLVTSCCAMIGYILLSHDVAKCHHALMAAILHVNSQRSDFQIHYCHNLLHYVVADPTGKQPCTLRVP